MKNNEIKSKISNYNYDSNKNFSENNSPEENHFKAIIFLQRMNLNNYNIK